MLTGLKWLINAVYDVEPIPSFALFDRQYQYIVVVFTKFQSNLTILVYETLCSERKDKELFSLFLLEKILKFMRCSTVLGK